jgi:hypothetical protein
MSERLPSKGERAASSRFFDVEFDADAVVKPVDVNAVDAGIFTADFYKRYAPVMHYSSAALQHWGVNENGEFFDRNDYSIKGHPQPGKELQQTVVLGLVWPQKGIESFSWQVNVADNVDREGGRRNRLHSLLLSSGTEWFGETRHYDSQYRQTRKEDLDIQTIADFYRAIRYLISCSGVEVQSDAFRADQVQAAPRLAELEAKFKAPKEDRKLPITAAEIQQWAELKRIGFQPAPWHHRLLQADLQ